MPVWMDINEERGHGKCSQGRWLSGASKQPRSGPRPLITAEIGAG